MPVAEPLKQPEAVAVGIPSEGARVAVLNTIELEGVSSEDWKGAASEALREAAKTLRNIRRMDILGTSAVIDPDGAVEYRTRVRLLFEVEPGRGPTAG